MAGSRWQDIFMHLESDGFEIYPPGIKIGDCISEYLVLVDDGSSRHVGISTDDDLYSVLCYVPKNQYSKLEPLVQRVKYSMLKLQPMILPNGMQTPSFYDDSFKAHMKSIQYKNHKFIPRYYDEQT